MSTPRKTRVAVVFGGQSTEHAVSCVSAGNILGAIDSGEFEIVPIGITRQGRWVLTGGEPQALEQLDGGVAGGALVSAGGVEVVDPRDGIRGLADVDVVFPVLHGAFGEDGTIQGLLEMAGLPYVGSGVFASAAAMDKEFGKKLAAAAGIPVGPHAVLRAGQSPGEADLARLGLPVLVKPARAGSYAAATKVSDWADLGAAVAAAREVDPKVLVEAVIAGREIEVGVLEGEFGGAPEASVCAELRSGSDVDVPADLPKALADRVRELAVQAFTALDCAGLAHVDFLVTPAGEVLFNEINTMPEFTDRSLFPTMWSASGLETPKLIGRLIRTALHRGTGLH